MRLWLSSLKFNDVDAPVDCLFGSIHSPLKSLLKTATEPFCPQILLPMSPVKLLPVSPVRTPYDAKYAGKTLSNAVSAIQKSRVLSVDRPRRKKEKQNGDRRIIKWLKTHLKRIRPYFRAMRIKGMIGGLPFFYQSRTGTGGNSTALSGRRTINRGRTFGNLKAPNRHGTPLSYPLRSLS